MISVVEGSSETMRTPTSYERPRDIGWVRNRARWASGQPIASLHGGVLARAIHGDGRSGGNADGTVVRRYFSGAASRGHVAPGYCPTGPRRRRASRVHQCPGDLALRFDVRHNIAYSALVLGVAGITFTAASLRSIYESAHDRGQLRKQMGLILLLLTTFGCELGAGIAFVNNVHDITALTCSKNVLVASLLIGIARAWEFVGARDTGLFASLAVLGGRRRASEPSVEGDTTTDDATNG